MSTEDTALELAESEVLVAEAEAAAPAATETAAETPHLLRGEISELRHDPIEYALWAEEERRKRRLAFSKARDWQIKFGPVAGKTGDLLEIAYSIEGIGIFRGERIVATDTASPAGCGTRIERLSVNGKPQDAVFARYDRLIPPAVPPAGILSVFADREVLTDVGNLFKLSVYFIESCTFEMTIIGKVLV